MTTFITYSGHIKHIHAPVVQDALFREPRVNLLSCAIWFLFVLIVITCAGAAVWLGSLAG